MAEPRRSEPMELNTTYLGARPYLFRKWPQAHMMRYTTRDALLQASKLLSLQELNEMNAATTLFVYPMAGGQQRWKDCLATRPDLRSSFSPDYPRALALASNCFPDRYPAKQAPIGVSTVLPGIGLGDQMIIASDPVWKPEYENLIADPLGAPLDYAYQNEPLGHGDALIRMLDSDIGRRKLIGAKTVIVNLGGATSRMTLEDGLLVMHTIRKMHESLGTGVLIPTTIKTEQALYPEYPNENGLLIGSGHVRLLGPESMRNGAWPSNIGLFIFDAVQLVTLLEKHKEEFERTGSYWINGKKVSVLGVDHLVQELMQIQMASQYAIAHTREIRNVVKEPTDINPWVRDMGSVYERDRLDTQLEGSRRTRHILGFNRSSKLPRTSEFDPILPTASVFDPNIQRLQPRHGKPILAVLLAPSENTNRGMIDYYRKKIGQIIGDNQWRQKTVNNVGNGYMGGECMPAGFGHYQELGVVVKAMRDFVGLPVKFYEATAVVPIEYALGNLMKITAHGAAQRGLSAWTVMANQGLVDAQGVKGKIKGLAAQQVLKVAELKTGAKKGEFDPDTLLTNHPEMAKLLLSWADFLNWYIFDKSLVKGLKRFRGSQLVKYAVTLNPPTARRNSENIVPVVPDMGYFVGLKGVMPGFGLEFAATHSPCIAVPDETSRLVLERFYDIQNAVVTGDNVGPLVDQELMMDKWHRTKQERILLTSTSGHGVNHEEIIQKMKDFDEYKKRKPDSPYTLIVSLINHQDNTNNDKIKQMIAAADELNAVRIKATWNTSFDAFKQEVLANKGKLITVQSEDMMLASFVQQWLKEIAVGEAVKPGEAHVMNPNLATFTWLHEPAFPNEILNGVKILLEKGSIAGAPCWKPFIEEYMKHTGFTDDKIREIIDSIPGLKGQSANFFDTMDDLFGDTEEGREKEVNRARQIALEGMINIKNGTLPVVALDIAVSTGKKLVGPYLEWVREQVRQFHISERDRKKDLVQRHFPQDAHIVIPEDSTEQSQSGTSNTVLRAMVAASVAAVLFGLGLVVGKRVAA